MLNNDITNLNNSAHPHHSWNPQQPIFIRAAQSPIRVRSQTYQLHPADRSTTFVQYCFTVLVGNSRCLVRHSSTRLASNIVSVTQKTTRRRCG